MSAQAKQIGYDNGSSGLTAVEVQSALDELAGSSGGGVREMFQYPVRTDGSFTNLGTWPLVTLTSVQEARCVFHLPSDFSSITELVILVIPDAGETINFDLASEYAGPGQAFNTHSASALNESKVVVNQQLAEIVVPASLYASIAANDYFALQISSDTDNIRVLGMRLKYT